MKGTHFGTKSFLEIFFFDASKRSYPLWRMYAMCLPSRIR